jgi:hypothetical protein
MLLGNLDLVLTMIEWWARQPTFPWCSLAVYENFVHIHTTDAHRAYC